MNPQQMAAMQAMQGGKQQVYVLNRGQKSDEGKQAQLGNISAGTAVADIIRTTLGPRSMLKMIIDMMGQIHLTSDGNAILREINVNHPAAKNLIDLSRTQDDQCGDGTTSVIILAGEMLQVAEPFVHKNIHPTTVVKGYVRALQDAIQILDKELAIKVDLKDYDQIKKIVTATVGTKFTSRFDDLMCKLSIQAVERVKVEINGKYEIDTKRYAKIEKIPGGSANDCCVLDGVMFEKDVLHAKMRRRIVNPRILLLDCPLEYKKGESMTNTNLVSEDDFEELLRLEEEYIKKCCDEIIKFKPDVVITEKGLSDLAQAYLVRAGISAIRRLRKTDNNRIARACGATVVHRTSEIREKDIGTQSGLFEVRKIGDHYFTFIEQCRDPKACTIILRGGSKDVLNEIERNLHDAIAVVRNLYLDSRIVVGGGATEMALSKRLMDRSKSIVGLEKLPYQAVALALEIIPKTLADNCGAKTIRVITNLRAKHAESGNETFGINGMTGEVTDMTTLNIYETYGVKEAVLQTAIECAASLLRIDRVVTGIDQNVGAAPNAPSTGATPFGHRPKCWSCSKCTFNWSNTIWSSSKMLELLQMHL
eukprot:CAMPEP_0117429056 /NCGR_PEP_ID=MMETSP0758-20121206/8633_1 /TAXON_ID=63605 /ORGANISM="Percolomonas cosmopolitus, Strain AE-1 (ATCC 50343)" /LENGTH=591 /DNA_ID=CAMNT_0005215769 /DNA_START=8 /DNA_END=1779 /DNA_ORIENTATION=+